MQFELVSVGDFPSIVSGHELVLFPDERRHVQVRQKSERTLITWAFVALTLALLANVAGN